ncbi:NADP-dependent oxidoreductase [Catellatospora tritici]|uniref:NADP-dependent oxidoreductase n=1 Tax=Catellatospora tritici TaxID=2851566 RepID=UPI001C2D725F|nr:NADP-dependent oxidoreductase [Catellatospora tritici]MBV1855609.1 NADP-dependent oxidoreductase [Catellatospora tritici]
MSLVVKYDAYGGPEVLRLVDVEEPVAGPGEIRVRVKVAGVQPIDVKVRRGDMAGRMPVTFPASLGNEFAGVVDQLGEGVTGLSIGDVVLGSANSVAYAEHVVTPATQVVAKPAQLDILTAGGLVAAAQTASGALMNLGVTSGDTLLVHAAAGSVGTVAVQLAREAGATVIGTASPGNHDYLRELGAIPVAYGPGLVDRVRQAAPQGVTVALDAIGGQEAIASSAALIADRSRIGTIADPVTAGQYGGRGVFAPRSPQRLAAVIELAAAGKVVMPVRTFPFVEVVDAHRAVESGHGRGKVVLLV